MLIILNLVTFNVTTQTTTPPNSFFIYKTFKKATEVFKISVKVTVQLADIGKHVRTNQVVYQKTLEIQNACSNVVR